jgi:hypothetical protein
VPRSAIGGPVFVTLTSADTAIVVVTVEALFDAFVSSVVVVTFAVFEIATADDEAGTE